MITNNIESKLKANPSTELKPNQAFVISDWDTSFENAQTRRTKHLNHALMPLRGQSGIHRRILAFEHGYKALALWYLIVQLAAECPQRGLLVKGTGPLNLEEIAIELGLPESDIREAFAILTHPKVQWIKIVECPQHLFVSGSLRKGRHGNTAPQAINVHEQKSGPHFYQENSLVVATEIKEDGPKLVTRKECAPCFRELYKRQENDKPSQSAPQAGKSVLEHGTNQKQTQEDVKVDKIIDTLRKERDRILAR